MEYLSTDIETYSIVFEWLFPNWSNPAIITALVGLRIVLNLFFVALTAHATGVRTRYTMLVAGLAIVSATILVLALRPGMLGRRASYIEILTQTLIVTCAGYAVYSNPTLYRWIAFAIVFIVAILFLLIMIPIYGEAFVAP